ncbi:ectoine/hydroxyectoine ABC transporter ATP-binding protein EhuA [Rhodoligotrophos defluvii]|uniref:ectoine/hydroxyectoine ABC transporter ATP-binding protein EhuA n=1 Tax=Rhodoligotrophos defluvii TaxID=2561934 RepID=UPI0010C9B06D|nr:ectoine/hydroxyectoine ABC transporter ATP-binding protein EhuA [Rhodoligotrophos defluvii]
MNPIIKLTDVRKSFGPLVVLDGLNMVVERGEKVALIGPSGSGKSTVLRAIMTLEPIDGGEIEIDGEPLWHMRKNGKLVAANEAHLRKMRAKVGMVFQHFNLFPHWSALKNVMNPVCTVLGLAKTEAQARAEELLALVGLKDKLHALPSSLSGGQQQRVAIARALAMRPRVMLFDEVTSALDPELVGEVLNVLRLLAHEHDLTMIMVTHQMGFAREIADRVLFFEKGRIVEEGKPQKVFTAPESDRTRAFLNAVLQG